MARKHEYERNEAIKKLIISAALDICLKEGYEAITVRGIGERIGYSTGVIYYHFKDKQDIMDSVDRMLDEETSASAFALVSPEKSMRENLSALYDFMCDLAFHNVETYKRIFTVNRIKENSNTRELWLKMFEDCLNAAKERGEIKCKNVTAVAKCVLAYIIGYDLIFFEIHKTSYEQAMSERETAVNTIINGCLSAE